MDPLQDLRAGDDALRSVDPLTRARLRMEAGEAEESRAEAERVAQRREEWHYRLQVQSMSDRCELAANGYLRREAEAMHRQAVEMRRGRIAELRQELARLEGQGDTWQQPTASDVERLAARTEAEALAGRDVIEAAKSRRRRREIARLEAEISRSRPRRPPATATAGGGLAPVDQDAGPTPAIGFRARGGPAPQRHDIPLAAPQFAHLLPGDW
jgi:hypothetical protein